jgi:hypothetical protein
MKALGRLALRKAAAGAAPAIALEEDRPMALSARFSLLHSDLNDFLFASVGHEQNGMPLSVISALTRLGVDPWEEAGRLAALPRALAAEAMASMIARFAIARPLRSDNLAVSHRLVELLPKHPQAQPPTREQTAGKDKRYFQALMLIGGFALGMAVLTAIW